jgi:hypothetical protein
VGDVTHRSQVRALALRWNGTAWVLQRTPGTGGILSAVSCTSARACSAVGSRQFQIFFNRTLTERYS